MQNGHRKLLIFFAIFAILVFSSVYFIFRPARPIEYSIQDFDVTLLTANSTFRRTQGLSGYSSEDLLSKADGMVFLFAEEEQRVFWMRNMEFPIDIVWIRDGQVVKIDRDVQPPEGGEEPERVSSQPFKVDAVIEFPAGGASKYGIVNGIRIPDLQN
jgi:hypothetical protein